MVLVIIAIVLATAQAAMAKPQIDQDLTVVSSTVLGEDTFTMTAWNMSFEAIAVDLGPPGVVSAVSVDTGVFDGHWVIDSLEAGAVGTMTGVIKSWSMTSAPRPTPGTLPYSRALNPRTGSPRTRTIV